MGVEVEVGGGDLDVLPLAVDRVALGGKGPAVKHVAGAGHLVLSGQSVGGTGPVARDGVLHAVCDGATVAVEGDGVRPGCPGGGQGEATGGDDQIGQVLDLVDGAVCGPPTGEKPEALALATREDLLSVAIQVHGGTREGGHLTQDGSGAQAAIGLGARGARVVVAKVAVITLDVDHGDQGLPDGCDVGGAQDLDGTQAIGGIEGQVAAPVHDAREAGPVVPGALVGPALEGVARARVDDDVLVRGLAVGDLGAKDSLGPAGSVGPGLLGEVAGRQVAAAQPAVGVGEESIGADLPLGKEIEVGGVGAVEGGHVGVGGAGAIGLGVPAREGVAVHGEGVGHQLHAIGGGCCEGLGGHGRGPVLAGPGGDVGVEVDGEGLGGPGGREGQGARHGQARHPGQVHLLVNGAVIGLPAVEGQGGVGVGEIGAPEGRNRASLGHVAKEGGALHALGEGSALARLVGDAHAGLPVCHKDGLADDHVVGDLLGGQVILSRYGLAAALVGDGPVLEVVAGLGRDGHGAVVGLGPIPDGLAVGAADGAQPGVGGGEGHGNPVALPLGVEVDRDALVEVEVVEGHQARGRGQTGVRGALDGPTSEVVALAQEAVGHVHLVAVGHGDLLGVAGGQVGLIGVGVVGIPDVAVELHLVGDGSPVGKEGDRMVGHDEGRGIFGGKVGAGQGVQKVAVH